MFTGIVEEAGEITEVVHLPDEALRIVVRGPVAVQITNGQDVLSLTGDDSSIWSERLLDGVTGGHLSIVVRAPLPPTR